MAEKKETKKKDIGKEILKVIKAIDSNLSLCSPSDYEYSILLGIKHHLLKQFHQTKDL